MARWAALLEKRRSEKPVMLLDAGDFCAVGKLRNQEIKNDYFFEAVRKIGYDALAVAENEILLGRKNLRKRANEGDLPLVSANILDRKSGKHLFDRNLVRRVGGSGFLFFRSGGIKVGIFSIADPELLYGADRLVKDYYEIIDPRIAALEAVSALEAQGCDMIVALSHMGWDLSAELAEEIPGLDIVVTSHSSMTEARFEDLDGVLIVAPGISRTSFTEIEVSWEMDGTTITVVDRGKDLLGAADHPEFAEIEKRYVEETGDTGEVREIE